MEQSFVRKDLLQCEAAAKGNLCGSLSVQYYQLCPVIVAQFTHKVSAQRVFCLLTTESELICIINPLLDINPKPYECKPHKYKPNQLVISKVDHKYCSLKFTEHSTFLRWQTLLSDALAETICCDSMKPLQSGRLSATRLSRCLSTCRLLTRTLPLVSQVVRLKSIRTQINDTLRAVHSQQCALASPEVRRVRAGCNFIQRIYPSLRSDPDLHYLTEQLRGGRHSAEDLQQLCVLLLHVKQEDKSEFVRMVRASTNSTTSAPTTTTTTSTVINDKHSTASSTHTITHKSALLLSPSKRITTHKRVRWDVSVLSQEKPRRRSRRHSHRPAHNNCNSDSSGDRKGDSRGISVCSIDVIGSNSSVAGVNSAGSTPRKHGPSTVHAMPKTAQNTTPHTHSIQDTTISITPEKVNLLSEPVVATPVPKPLHTTARILSPHKRIRNNATSVSRSWLHIALAVLIVVMCGLYAGYSMYSGGGYTALTFSSTAGTTTVSISVSSTAPAIVHATPAAHTTPSTTLANSSSSADKGVTYTPDHTIHASTPVHTSLSIDTGISNAVTNFSATNTHYANTTQPPTTLHLNVVYAHKSTLSPVKNAFSRLTRIALSPIKLIRSLCHNAWRVWLKLSTSGINNKGLKRTIKL